ncbi:MAG: TetR family transcriptional regulator [Propionibacteriales bacterium]|nr:TetR family transcriptional regulator [Propionibacteriales bacterium]
MIVSQSVRRRRRRPDEAAQEILDAAATLFTERISSEVTVSEVMRHTTLSRKSFYVYFRDRHDLLTRLVQPIRAESDQMVERLRETRREDPATAGKECLRDHARLYLRHGRLLRAIASASEQDTEARTAWRTFVDPVVDALAELIREETDEGRSSGLDPDAIARALVGMNVSYFLDQIVDKQRTDIDTLADTLLTVWIRTLYA